MHLPQINLHFSALLTATMAVVFCGMSHLIPPILLIFPFSDHMRHSAWGLPGLPPQQPYCVLDMCSSDSNLSPVNPIFKAHCTST